jgi:hypothetical protein
MIDTEIDTDLDIDIDIDLQTYIQLDEEITKDFYILQSGTKILMCLYLIILCVIFILKTCKKHKG